MIRDFLDHLLWEVRIDHYEQVASGTNSELKEQLTKYIRKRQTVGLLFATMLEEEEPDPLKMAEYRTLRAEFRKSQLLCLEALRSLFEEALRCAAKPDKLNAVNFETIDEAIAFIKRRKKEHETGEP
jgi:hypothetical protein